MSAIRLQLLSFYKALHARYGPQGWWPANSAMETIIGCILVQHANWVQVQRAIEALRTRDLLDFSRIAAHPEQTLSEIIRSAGTPRVKAARLKAFARWLGQEYAFSLDGMFEAPTRELRNQLLSIKGIGPETADCILLYAGGRPSFVVDTYTRRVLVRHFLAEQSATYDQLKGLFESCLDADSALFNEYHALLVQVGKKHCRTTARCADCPLDSFEHLAPD